MKLESCEGCVQARSDGGIAVPASPECLGCRRALPHAPGWPDLWLARPPGGSLVACDEWGLSFTAPFPEAARHAAAALAALAGLFWISGGSVAALALVLATVGIWSGISRRTAGVRHYWNVWGERVWHVVEVWGLAITRSYPADTIRAFHCAGPRAGGPVGFHHGRYTVRVATLLAPQDNEWLMRCLNDRLARERAPTAPKQTVTPR